RAQQLLALRGPALSLRDVARDLRRTDDGAVFIPDRGDGERDVEQGAVFAAAHRLVVVDTLAAADARQDGRLLVLALRWNQDGHRAADRFRGGVAEQLLRTQVPTGDDPVQVFADDGVVG